MPAHREEWDRSLRDALAACRDEVLAEAWVDEMGLYGPEEDPFFTHSKLKFVQAYRLELRFESGETLQIGCFQDDDQFALWPRRVSVETRLAAVDDPSRTLFRVRPMAEFPTGRVTQVDWETDERANMQVISLCLDKGDVILRAGEVEEDMGGSLTIRDRDESVLIFLDRGDYDQTIFNAPAYRAE